MNNSILQVRLTQRLHDTYEYTSVGRTMVHQMSVLLLNSTNNVQTCKLEKKEYELAFYEGKPGKKISWGGGHESILLLFP